MKLTSIVPVLYVPDVSQGVRFYCDVLGFECTGPTDGWACVEKNGVELMLSVPNAHLPFEKPQFTGSLYFKLDSPAQVDELWNSLKDKVRVVYPIEDFEYGMREFGIYDNDGYILNFGSEISG